MQFTKLIPLYLVSSDTDLNQAQLTTIYQRRWKVEEYHKSLKQNASMAKSPTKTLATQATHFFAAVLAYTKLEVLKLKCGIGHFRLKAQLYAVGLKAMYQHPADECVTSATFAACLRSIAPTFSCMKTVLLLILRGMVLLLPGLTSSPFAQAQAPAWQSVAASTATANGDVEFLAPTSNGDIIVAGTFRGSLTLGSTTLTSAGQFDVFVAKFSPATGTYVWAQRAGGTGNETNYGVAVNGNNVYIVGFSSGGGAVFGGISLPPANLSGYVAKLTDAGSSAAFTWAKALDDGSGVYATALAVSGSAVYVGGDYTGTSMTVAGGTLTGNASGDDGFVVKLTDTGSSATYNWGLSIGTANAAGTNYTSIIGLVPSGASVYAGTGFGGSLTLAGTTMTSAGSQDVALVKLQDAGNSASVVSAVRIGGGPNSDFVNGIGKQGNVIYLSGIAGANSTWAGATYAGAGGYVAKVVDTGSALSNSWAWVLPSASAYQLAVNGAGVYVAGSFSGTVSFGSTSLTSAGGNDGYVARLNDAGGSFSVTWAKGAGGTASDQLKGIALSHGRVYVGGTVMPVANFGPITVSSPVGIAVPTIASLIDPLLLATLPAQKAGTAAVFPNPARAWATVPVPAGTTAVRLYDALGREVRHFPVPPDATAITVDLHGVPAGLYRAQGGGISYRLVVE